MSVRFGVIDGFREAVMAKESRMLTGRRPFLAAMGGVAMTTALGLAAAKGPAVGSGSTHRPTVLAFDGIETLLDIRTLTPFFERLFGDGNILQEWFGQTILYSETATLTRKFTPFSNLSAGVLRMVGEIRQVTVKPEHVDELKALIAAIPPHPDVPQGLRTLKNQGFRLATLTDSPVPASSNAGPLAKAGVAELFERQFSAESVQQYKPARATYQMVSQELKVAPASVCMIAAHVWDLIGAKSAGCMTALITRPGVAPLELAGVPLPDITGPTLTEVAEALVALGTS